MDSDTAGAPRRPRGFSLVEVLMAVALFAAAFLVLLGAFPKAAEVLGQAQGYMVAGHLAERELTRSAALPHADIASATQTVSMTSSQRGTSQTVVYTVQTVVTEVSGRLKKIQVVVSWPAGRRTLFVELATSVVDLG